MEILTIFIVAALIFTLAVLFVVFDTIKRIKGKFNQGWKTLFFGFSVFFAFQFMYLLRKLYFVNIELAMEILKVIFVTTMLVSFAIINKKVREFPRWYQKKEHRTTKR